MDVLLFLLSFIVLWKASDFFVDSTHAMAIHLKMPPMLIGATVVAFGTSAPELFVTVFASLNHHNDVVYGNIFGSNIANVLLILGLSFILQQLPFNKEFRNYLWLNLLVIIGIIFLLFTWSPSRVVACICLALFVCIQFFLIRNKFCHNSDSPQFGPFKSVMIFFSSLFFLIISSRLLVTSLLEIAVIFGISTTFLSLFLIAFGTSLPELATTVSFFRKNHMGIVVGNVFGSNLFNLFFVLPAAWLVNPMVMPSNFFIELVVILGVTIFLMALSYLFKYSKKWFGGIFVCGYFLYIFLIFSFLKL